MAWPVNGVTDWWTKIKAMLSVSLADDGKIKDGAVMESGAAPTADAGVSNKKYVDDQITSAVAGTGFFHASSATIFNTHLTTANTFQNLDIATEAGITATSMLVFLQVKCSGSGVFFIKPKGEGSTVTDHTMSGYTGGGNCQFGGTNRYSYFTMATDTSGIIQIGANTNSDTFTIKLLGYIR